jgi:hypothetical protein
MTLFKYLLGQIIDLMMKLGVMDINSVLRRELSKEMVNKSLERMPENRLPRTSDKMIEQFTCNWKQGKNLIREVND